MEPMNAQSYLPTPGEEVDAEVDPVLQEKYLDVYAAASLLMDDEDTFKQTRKSLQQEQKDGMLVPFASQMIVTMIGRIEKDFGELEPEILETLINDLTTGISDNYGIETSEEEEGNIAAGAIGLWARKNPERATEGMTEEDMAQLRAMVDEAGQEFVQSSAETARLTPGGEKPMREGTMAPQEPQADVQGLLGGV